MDYQQIRNCKIKEYKIENVVNQTIKMEQREKKGNSQNEKYSCNCSPTKSEH